MKKMATQAIKESTEALRNKLKSATQSKLTKERELYKLRNLDRSLNEKLTLTNNEIEHMKETLQELKTQISKAEHQLVMIEVCKSSEKLKIEAHIDSVTNHGEAFEDLFNKERETIEFHNKDLRKKEAEQQEIKQQQKLLLVLKDEQQLQEALLVEAEADTLEQECAVLKKRNNAIMLKLRRQLIETEETRRKLFNK